MHVHHHERHVERLECGRGAAATADRQCGGRLAAHSGAIGVEQPLDDCHQCAVGLPVIDGGADDEGISLFHLLRDPVADIVVEDASSDSAALAAGDAAANGLGSEPYDLAFNAFGFQRPGDFAKGGGGIALGVRASVYHQYFHSPPV